MLLLSSAFKDFEPHRAGYRATRTRINPITGVEEPVSERKIGSKFAGASPIGLTSHGVCSSFQIANSITPRASEISSTLCRQAR